VVAWRRLNIVASVTLLVLIVLSLVFFLATATSAPAPSLWTNVRLPTTVLPLHYWLFLSTDMGALTYTGVVTIALNVRALSRELHGC